MVVALGGRENVEGGREGVYIEQACSIGKEELHIEV